MNIDPMGGIFSQGLALIDRGAKDKSFALVYHDFCTKFEDLLQIPTESIVEGVVHRMLNDDNLKNFLFNVNNSSFLLFSYIRTST